VGGRIVHAEGERALVRDATGSLELRLHGEAPPMGAWIVAEGLFDGTALVVEALAVETIPSRPFPAPDGDWTRLQADGGRRAEILRRRADVLAAVRELFDGRGFVEVETPLVVPSPGLELHLAALEVVGQNGPRYLGTSPEYHMKRLLSGGLARIYQISKCFREGELGATHEPEFTMLEWYRTFADSGAIMRDTEELVAHVARTVRDGDTRVSTRDGVTIDLAPPWDRMTVDEALRLHAGTTLAALADDEDAFDRAFVEKLEPVLGRERPVFLTHWPARAAALARLCPDDPTLADRVEAFAGGLELSNGFGELVDAKEQRARLERDDRERARRGLPRYPIDERFLSALEEGLPPCAGNALGLDRLVMLVLELDDIADALAFPSGR
jgi:lysyl-tRNA synthetase class 2